VITVADIRKAIEGKADTDPVNLDVMEGPDEWSVDLVGVEGDKPKHWEGVGNASELGPAVWIHVAIVPMNDEEEEKEANTHKIVVHILGAATLEQIAAVNKIVNHEPDSVDAINGGTDLTYSVQEEELDDIVDGLEDSDIVDTYDQSEI
jgi:hypothetical protein